MKYRLTHKNNNQNNDDNNKRGLFYPSVLGFTSFTSVKLRETTTYYLFWWSKKSLADSKYLVDQNTLRPMTGSSRRFCDCGNKGPV